MKPQQASYAGVLVRNRVYPSQGINDVQTYSYASGSLNVTCGPLVRGNHKSPNPWYFSVARRQNGPLSAVFTNTANGDTDYWSGNYVGITENVATWLSADMDAAVAAAYSDLLNEIRGGMDLSVDIFQGKQTIGTPKQILKILTEMRKVSRQLRKGDIVKPMKQAGNAWLIWVYGVKPTMQTIHDAIKFRRDHYLNEVKVFEGKATRVTEKVINIPDWPDAGGWTSQLSVRTSCRCRYKVRMKIPDSALTSATRLSSLNPASIAWELMPWSFVVDWFLNIGDYLRGIETTLVYGRYFTDGFVTKTFISEGDQSAMRSGVPPPGVSWSGTYRATGVNKSFDRAILSALPSVPSPKFRPELGSGRLLNAAALLTTFLGRKS